MGCRSITFLRACLATFTLALAACSGSEAPATCGASVKSCGGNADCGGMLCENGCCTDKRTCASDAECPNPLVCNGGLCAEKSNKCTSSTECKQATPALPVCNVQSGECVACVIDTDCGTSGTKTCDAATHTCKTREGVCFRDADCASSDIGSHCRVTAHACVECLLPQHCIGGNVCGSDFKCHAANGSCTTNSECTDPKPVCDAAHSVCVECMDEGDCGVGRMCSANVCVDVPTGCTKADDCAQNLNGHVCDVASGDCVQCSADGDCDPQSTCQNHACVPRQTGCTNDAGCTAPTAHCNSATGQCVACTATTQCPANNTCQAFACVPNTTPTGCTADAQCTTSGDRNKCVTVDGPLKGTCVQCRTGADCPSGLCDDAGACKPGCAADANCAAPTPKCDLTAHACVGCLASTDCGAGNICQGSACIPGCSTASDCAATPATSKCKVDTHACVACLIDGDCGAGKRCDQNQCVTIPTGTGDVPCAANDVCAAGTTCVPEADGTKICRKDCAPYAPGTTCGTDKVCAWIDISESNALTGACLPKNGRGASGTVCQTGDDCEVDLFCMPTSATERRCEKLCNPTGGTCGTGDSCHTLPAFFDAATDAMVNIGICLPTASNFYKPCNSDYSTNNAGGTRPDCGADMTCGPNTPVLDPSIRLSVCQYPVGTGEARTSCTDGAQCRTGDCLAGPKICDTACHWASDCTRAGLNANYKCLPYLWIGESDFTGDATASTTGACLPTCKSDANCAAGTFCMLSPTFENSGAYQSSFYGYCYPRLGTTTGPNKAAGARCSADGECASGQCVTNGSATATDGYCFGTCDTARTGQCDAANGVVCDPSGLGLFLNDGKDARAGTADDAYGRAFVCSGKRCANDADCAGASGDSSKPRSCQLQLQVNGANSEYDSTTTELRMTCEPRVGAKKGGGTCTANSDCQTGLCLTFDSGESLCFGACKTNSDCDGRSSECALVNYGTQTLQTCAPN